MHKLIDNHFGNEQCMCTNIFTIYLKHALFVNLLLSLYSIINSLHINFVQEYKILILRLKKYIYCVLELNEQKSVNLLFG